MRRLLALVLAAASCGAAAPPPLVAELTVTPKPSCLPARRVRGAPPPRVLSTYPAQGAVVRPGVLVVRITFDQQMTCGGSFGVDTALPSPCRPGRQSLLLSPNRRTVRTICEGAPAQAYTIRLGGPDGERFVSVRGARLAPYDLSFTTSAEAPVRSLREALAQDPEFRPPAESR